MTVRSVIDFLAITSYAPNSGRVRFLKDLDVDVTDREVVVIEDIVEDHEWLRVADPSWVDPLDSTFAATAGGRWNPPDSFRVLYLNEDVVTARLNLRTVHLEPRVAGNAAARSVECAPLRGESQ